MENLSTVIPTQEILSSSPLIPKQKKKYIYTKKTGAPALYLTPQDLDARVVEYFSDTKNMYKVKKRTAFGEEYEQPVPTISDLVLFLGFADRHSFYAYEVRPEFSNIIKKARTMIERIYESNLHGGNCVGSIFALKNFGWTDKVEVQGGLNVNYTLNALITTVHRAVEKIPR